MSNDAKNPVPKPLTLNPKPSIRVALLLLEQGLGCQGLGAGIWRFRVLMTPFVLMYLCSGPYRVGPPYYTNCSQGTYNLT